MVYDSNWYDSLSDVGKLFLLSEKQIYLLEEIDNLITSGNFDDTTGLDLDGITGDLIYALQNPIIAPGGGMPVLLEAKRTTVQTFVSGQNYIVFDEGDYNPSIPQQLVIPADVTKIIVTANIKLVGAGSSTPRGDCNVILNDETIILQSTGQAALSAHSTARVVSVVSGDVLRLGVVAQNTNVELSVGEILPTLTILGFA